ncbi:DUF4190 domain-containing protein [Schumannella sp. 10F1B-5-1]|uniref:DUF4190 domain-containing protein n=1 Tax=Schumannella sp. 10F1B-5-1 TaxID=2590780 RepID=UPI001130D142|nr:DUF4190 domain-containing protein [Schumannella sp. 10F1B-5-1]TPW71775.1 DUF4190 domain-containing protein [Schumannella sp. 10F1B-5-1]
MTATPPPAQPTGYTPAPAAKTNTLAIVGLILAFVVSLGGLIVSLIALNQIKQTGEGGRGLALAGVIISAIGLVIGVLYIIFAVILVGTAGTTGY